LQCQKQSHQDFYRIQKLPPYVFAVINEMRAKARAAQIDVIDLGMGNPDGATPRVVVSKLVEAARNARNHRYSQSRGIPRLREEITKRYLTNYGVELDPEQRSHRHHRRQGCAGAPAVRHRRSGRCGGLAEPGVPDSSIRRDHGRRHACMLPMPDAADVPERARRPSTAPPRASPRCC
jgi:alanine-synthesizing transaminase